MGLYELYILSSCVENVNIHDFYTAAQNIQFLQPHLWYPNYILCLFYCILYFNILYKLLNINEILIIVRCCNYVCNSFKPKPEDGFK